MNFIAGSYQLGGTFFEFNNYPPIELLTYGEIKEKLKNCRHEGYMIHTSDGEIYKLKSPYYSDIKTIARAKPTKLDSLVKFQKKLETPEVQQFLVSKIDTFKSLDEQGRIALLRQNEYLFGE
jgi:deoxyribodipyrimidine photolyase